LGEPPRRSRPTQNDHDERQSILEGANVIRVLLVDDHGVVRRGLRGYLELLEDIEIVGEADNGLTAIELSAQLSPDVVLMDLVMPQLDGIAAIGRIKAAQPEVQVVALTSFIEEEKVIAALEAGASGFILKDAEADDVAAAIRAAHNDEVHLDPAAARILAKGMRTRSTAPVVEPLTERELEVLALVGRGRSNKEIATDLGITERTARTHVSNILGKLGLASRTQAALYAVERRLVTGPE
jgi:two-component system, NarL family, response regulator LiaR